MLPPRIRENALKKNMLLNMTIHLPFKQEKFPHVSTAACVDDDTKTSDTKQNHDYSPNRAAAWRQNTLQWHAAIRFMFKLTRSHSSNQETNRIIFPGDKSCRRNLDANFFRKLEGNWNPLKRGPQRTHTREQLLTLKQHVLFDASTWRREIARRSRV